MKSMAATCSMICLTVSPAAQAAVYSYSCKGTEMIGVNSKTPGKSGGLKRSKIFTFRLMTQGNQITGWSSGGDRPTEIWVTEAMLSTVPFRQSCKIFSDGNAARSCNFSISQQDVLMMDLQTSSGNTGFFIERIGTQPFTATFRFEGNSRVSNQKGTTSTVSYGTCTVR